MYRYYLDTTLLNGSGSDPKDEPQGWNQLVTTLKRDRVLKGILKTIDVQMLFGGVGYTYLKNILDTSSFCGSVNFKIQKSCDGGNVFSDFYNGVIFISDLEFDEKRCVAKAKISDNSFYAKINNNKSLECLPYVGTSKNQSAITPAPYKLIQFFKPSDGSYYSLGLSLGTRNCTGFKVYDILKFLVTFMTDGEVLFDSTLFGTGGEWQDLMLTYGMVVSTVTTGIDQDVFEENFPKLTFEKTFTELDRLLNLGFYVDYSTTKPTLFIEKYQDLNPTTTILSTPDVNELKTSTAVDYLYSILKLGSNNWNSNHLLSYPDDIDWIGFKAEQYNILGVCNLDRTFDITRDWVVDTNSIEDALINNDPTNDDKIFLIDCTFSTGSVYTANKTNILTGSPPPYFYNEVFTNNQIAKRFLGSVPNSIAFYLGSLVDSKFQATKTSQTPLVGAVHNKDLSPVIFQDDFTSPNFDANNKYNRFTGKYTISASGQYTFYSLLNFSVKHFDPISQQVRLRIDLLEYDSTFTTLLNTYYFNGASGTAFDNQTPNVVHYYTVSGSQTVNTTAGHIFVINAHFERSASSAAGELVILLEDSIYACTKDVTGGGVYQSYDPADYSVLLHSYEYPFTDSDYNTILNSITGMISFNRNGQDARVGWIEQIKFNHWSGKMDVILNSNKKINS